MLKRTGRILFRISSVLSKVEPEPGAGAGPSHPPPLRQKRTGSSSTTLPDTESVFILDPDPLRIYLILDPDPYQNDTDPSHWL